MIEVEFQGQGPGLEAVACEEPQNTETDDGPATPLPQRTSDGRNDDEHADQCRDGVQQTARNREIIVDDSQTRETGREYLPQTQLSAR